MIESRKTHIRDGTRRETIAGGFGRRPGLAPRRRRGLALIVAVTTIAAGVAANAPLAIATTAATTPRDASATTPVGVAQALYPSTGQQAACVTVTPGTSPIPAESFAACPVSPALAAALTRFAAGNQADPLCRCQNTFTVTIATKPSGLPSGYKGPRSDKTVKVTLGFGGVGGNEVIFVVVHKNRDGSWVASDTYCAARRRDTNPYRNRMTATPKDCAPV